MNNYTPEEITRLAARVLRHPENTSKNEVEVLAEYCLNSMQQKQCNNVSHKT